MTPPARKQLLRACEALCPLRRHNIEADNERRSVPCHPAHHHDPPDEGALLVRA